MMSLVAYGSSDDDSDAEEEVEHTVASEIQAASKTTIKENIKDASIVMVKDVEKREPNANTDQESTSVSPREGARKSPNVISDGEPTNNNKLFSQLPTPTALAGFLALRDIVPGKKSLLPKGPVRITIPSLSGFDDDDEPPAKKKVQQSAKGTKLTSMLPPPKGAIIKDVSDSNTKPSLVPQSVTRKPTRPVKKSPMKNGTPAVPPKPKNLINYEDSEEDSGGEDSPSDFFSLTVDHSVPAAEMPTTSNEVHPDQNDIHSYEATASNFSAEYQSTEIPDYSSSFPEPQADSGQDYIPFGSEDLQLDEEALQKLCGRKGRHAQENVQIIDVSGDALMPDSREWFTKQLTQEQPKRSSARKTDGPSSQQRRKHQITYLAFQAKENELELQNQWANNRQSRRQTQSKYGF